MWETIRCFLVSTSAVIDDFYQNDTPDNNLRNTTLGMKET